VEISVNISEGRTNLFGWCYKSITIRKKGKERERRSNTFFRVWQRKCEQNSEGGGGFGGGKRGRGELGGGAEKSNVNPLPSTIPKLKLHGERGQSGMGKKISERGKEVLNTRVSRGQS